MPASVRRIRTARHPLQIWITTAQKAKESLDKAKFVQATQRPKTGPRAASQSLRTAPRGLDTWKLVPNWHRKGLTSAAATAAPYRRRPGGKVALLEGSAICRGLVVTNRVIRASFSDADHAIWVGKLAKLSFQIFVAQIALVAKSL